MVGTKSSEATAVAAAQTTTQSEYDRMSELKAFDETRSGVKGLIDSGVKTLPKMFVAEDPLANIGRVAPPGAETLPTIDLAALQSPSADPASRAKIVDEIRRACEEWGFFQVINHGIPVEILEQMQGAVKRFHEQEPELKKPYYSRDLSRRFKYDSNFDLYKSKTANWRDTFHCIMAPVQPDPEEMPDFVREILFNYANRVHGLGLTLLELFSEGLGLKKDHLKKLDCGEGMYFVGHYYPACPQPELAVGTTTHTDTGFFTVLLQDHIGGLQVQHKEEWVDVPPVHGALVINIADLLQLITNDRYKSVYHRVVSQKQGPRISVACFFRTHVTGENGGKLYGPIKELLNEENPAVYKDITISEFVAHFYQKGLGTSALDHFKVSKD